MEHRIALTLDKKVFEVLMRTSHSTRPDFVLVDEVPKATIATNLATLVEAK